MNFVLFFLTMIVILNAKKDKSKNKTEKNNNEKMGTVIGIDLGTTYSCVGVYVNGRVEIIANDLGSRITPSWVSFTDTDRLIGDGAKSQVVFNPENTIYDMKRLIGRKWDDPEVQRDIKLYPFKIVNRDEKPVVQVSIKGEIKEFAPEEISAMVLGKMKSIAETYLGKPIKNAVVTCPAYFNDAQRQATKDAGTIAGLNVVRVLNEPTAAAIAYGMDKKDSKERNVIVYDLGGGTFDVSLLQIDNGVFEVLSTSGNTHLGGEDFDQNVVNYLSKLWSKKTGKDISKNNRCLQKLRREVEKAKCGLSTSYQVTIEIDNFLDGLDFRESLTRARFEELNNNLFLSTLKPMETVLKDAHLKKSDIDDVVLVGGSSRIPRVVQLVKEFFGGKEPVREINPDEAVAYGAALQASLLSDEENNKINEEMVIIDRTPLSVGIETVGGVMTPLVDRNTIIPCKKSKVFSTHEDNQNSVLIKVYEGDRSMVKDNHELGEFQLSGIPPAKRGVPQIEVTFEIDSNGILSVTALDLGTRNKKSHTIKNEKRLSASKIAQMQKDAERYKQEDEEARNRIKKWNELENYIYNLEDQLEDENKMRGKINDEDEESIKEGLSETKEWMDHNKLAETEEIELHLKSLQKIVEPIISQFYENNNNNGRGREREREEEEDDDTTDNL